MDTIRFFAWTITLSLLFLMVGTTAVQAQSPVGLWRTIDDETDEPRSIVEIYEEDDKLYGRIVEILQPTDDPPRNEEGQIICTECEGERKDQPIEGMIIIEGMERDGDRWTGGQIIDPTNGRSYRCILEPDGDQLKVRGYIGISAFGRTQVWQRADGANADSQ